MTHLEKDGVILAIDDKNVKKITELKNKGWKVFEEVETDIFDGTDLKK